MFLNILYLHKNIIMKNKILLFFLLLSAFYGFSQDENYSQTKKSIYIYTIENIDSQDKLDNLKTDVEKIKGISDIKFICKWETGKGQLIFTYSENISGNENIENVDMVVIKQLILKNNLIFADFKVK